MKKLLFLLLIPLLIHALATKRHAAQKDLAASVVLHIKTITVNKKGEKERGFYVCSGTYISPYTILTAAHCFVGTDISIWARGPYESVGYPTHLVYWDKKADLAILDAPFGHTYVKLGPVPNWGDRVMNIGNPFDYEFVQSEGKVGPTDYMVLGGTYSSEYLVTTAMANPGSSGGGAFNDRGELVGVNTMVVGLFGWSGLTMAVNTTSIELFLGQALRNYKHYGGE
jgi:S1-C subfamily serine protease